MERRIQESQSGCSPWGKLKVVLETVKAEYTFFTLPFAYVALLFVEQGIPRLSVFVWITLAMVGFRTFGFGVNRLVDEAIDGQNPRTAGRALPAGLLKRREVVGLSLAGIGLFLAAVYQLSDLAQTLWPAVIVAGAGYSYTKRFTWATHFVLGFVYFMVPTGVWVGVSNGISLGAVLLGIGAGLWAAGFDVIQSAQDADHDRRNNIHSIPAKWGIARGLILSRWFHVGTITSLLFAGLALSAGFPYYLGMVIVSLLLIRQHRIVNANDLSRLNEAFFVMNSVVSFVLLVFVFLDIVVRE